MPFREVVGVELNPELAASASRNGERWAALGKAQCAIRVVRGDATEVELPEGPLLLYLYNPFTGEVLRRLLELLDGWAARGGRLEIAYLYPEQDWVFAEFPRFRRLWKEVIALSPADTGVDGVSAVEDPCVFFRWIG